MKYFIFGIFFSIHIIVDAQPRGNANDYVQKYKDLAISEMNRSGIPASIILAQGMLESSFGQNSLALHANNHFAVRCSENWSGDTFYKWGNKTVTPVCYKSYQETTQSYFDHTDALLESQKFSELFYFPKTAYKKWAKGLEELEYAKIPDYGKQLINIIELYKLNEYDEMLDPYNLQFEAEPEEGELEDEIYYNNGIKAILSNGESPLNTASRLDIPLRKLLKFNDLSISGAFYQGQFIYLQSKKNTFTGEKEVHVVQASENMYKIAQLYGVKLKTLYKKNLMREGQEAATDQRVYLKNTAPRRPTLRPKEEQIATNIEESEEVSTPQPPITITTEPTTIPTQPVPEISEPKFNLGEYSIHPDEIKTKPQKVYVYPDEPAYLNQKEKNTFYRQIIGDENIESGIPIDVEQKEETETVTQPSATIEPGARRLTPPELVVPVATTNTTAIVPSTILEPGSRNRMESTLEPPKNIESPAKFDGVYHIVIKGDTLYNISKRYKTTVDKIKKLNALEDNTIGLNQQLQVE